MTKPLSTRDLAVAAMIAALYTTLCLALSPFAYGPIQVRVAEALTLLPVFSPVAIWGVTLGCALSNMVGANPLGFVDVIVGTFATLVAAILSYKFRNIRFCGKFPVLSAIPPVLVNAVVIGFELTLIETNGFSIEGFLAIAGSIGLGQTIACFVLGLPLVYLLEKTKASEKMFKE